MQNIIRSQLFQLKRDKIVKWMFVICLLFQLLLIEMNVILESQEYTGGQAFVEFGGQCASFPLFFLIVATAQICGTDFLDKTSHYELMSGHKRKEVYLGRVITALMVVTILAWLLTMLPVVISTGMYGWGTKLPIEYALIRSVLLLFPFARMICEFAFLTYLFKNPYIVMGIAYLFFVISASGMVANDGYMLGITNISVLFDIDTWATYGMEADMNYIYDASVKGVMILKTIGMSVIIGVVSLYLGYVFFKHDDQN